MAVDIFRKKLTGWTKSKVYVINYIFYIEINDKDQSGFPFCVQSFIEENKGHYTQNLENNPIPMSTNNTKFF